MKRLETPRYRDHRAQNSYYVLTSQTRQRRIGFGPHCGAGFSSALHLHQAKRQPTFSIRGQGGRAAALMAKGYKLHAIASNKGLLAWRIDPMNKDERVMAHRMIRSCKLQGYLVADSNYDSNPLHEVCLKKTELQMITPRRHGKGHGLGHHRQSRSRLAAIKRTENPFPKFAERLLHDRKMIERTFGNLVNWGGGLTTLPSWVRTYRRVHRWVQAKLIFSALKRSLQLRTYAA